MNILDILLKTLLLLLKILALPFKTFCQNGWLPKIMSGILFMIYGLILGSIFFVVDSSFLPIKEGNGTIVEKEIIPAYTTLILVGKTTVPQFHPKRWILTVKVNEETDLISVTKKYYSTVNNMDIILVEYVNGRLSSGIYIKNILE